MPSNPRVKYNVRFLKDREIRETFQITLSNRYLQLQDLDTEDEWKEIRKALNNTCEEVLGFHLERWKPSRRGRHSGNVTEAEPDTRRLSPGNCIKRRTKRLGGSLRKIKEIISVP